VFNRLRSKLDAFEQSDSESIAIELRMQFARILLGKLRELKWSQRKLAEQAGMHESQISKLIHGDENCTLGTLAKLLFVLRVRATVTESPFISDFNGVAIPEKTIITEASTNGKETECFSKSQSTNETGGEQYWEPGNSWGRVVVYEKRSRSSVISSNVGGFIKIDVSPRRSGRDHGVQHKIRGSDAFYGGSETLYILGSSPANSRDNRQKPRGSRRKDSYGDTGIGPLDRGDVLEEYFRTTIS
jgi:transcriptional regulator with XRE-family HTH domain